MSVRPAARPPELITRSGVPARSLATGKTTNGEFVVYEGGRFEVESHHLEKVIVILNVR